MACSPHVRVAVFSSLCTLFISPAIHAQSRQETPQTCQSPCVSADELKEMGGKKIYPKIIVDDVRFDSPLHLPDSSEEPQIISEIRQHVLDLGSEGLEEVLETRIRGAWEDQGYFKVRASGQTQVMSSDAAYEHVLVTIHVDPGQQYRLGSLGFRSSDPDAPETLAFPQEELRKLIPLQEGDIFNTTKIRESLDAMKKFYDSHGFINFVATPITDVDDVALRISLVMELSEDKQFRVRKVEVFGLKPSKAAMLTSTVKPGDVFQNRLVEAFVKANRPEFLDVNSSEVLDMRKDEKEGTVDVMVDFRRLPKK